MFEYLRLANVARTQRERTWAGVPRAVMIFFATALLLHAGIKLQVPAGKHRAVRVVQNRDESGGQWTITEMRVFSGKFWMP